MRRLPSCAPLRVSILTELGPPAPAVPRANSDSLVLRLPRKKIINNASTFANLRRLVAALECVYRAYFWAFLHLKSAKC